MCTSRLRPVAVGIASTIVAGCLGWFVLATVGSDRVTNTVEFIDRTAEFERILEERRTAGEPDGAAGDGLLVREEDRAQLLELLRSPGRRMVSDPQTYYRLVPRFSKRFPFAEHPEGSYAFVTNDLGMRNDEDVRSEQPDVRILVTGDSHTEGLCSNSETFTALLENALSSAKPEEVVEALNAGVSSYNHYNYVGVLERYAELLRPDVFVVVFFGGNDFAGALKFQRLFRHRGRYENQPYDPSDLESAGLADDPGFIDQEIRQLCYFLNNPGEIAEIHALNLVVTREILRLSAASGIRTLLVYLPPPSRGQPERYAEYMGRVAEVFGVAPADLEVTDTIADAWLGFLADEGIPHVDLRPVFRAIAEPLYWSDGHINLLGHRTVAATILDEVRALAEWAIPPPSATEGGGK